MPQNHFLCVGPCCTLGRLEMSRPRFDEHRGENKAHLTHNQVKTEGNFVPVSDDIFEVKPHKHQKWDASE